MYAVTHTHHTTCRQKLHPLHHAPFSKNTPCHSQLLKALRYTHRRTERRQQWHQDAGQRLRGFLCGLCRPLSLSAFASLTWSMDSSHRELTCYWERPFGKEAQNKKLFSQAEGAERIELLWTFSLKEAENTNRRSRAFMVLSQTFLFFQCKNWAEAVAFTFTTLDLADHVFPLLGEERKEDQISF